MNRLYWLIKTNKTINKMSNIMRNKTTNKIYS